MLLQRADVTSQRCLSAAQSLARGPQRCVLRSVHDKAYNPPQHSRAHQRHVPKRSAIQTRAQSLANELFSEVHREPSLADQLFPNVAKKESLADQLFPAALDHSSQASTTGKPREVPPLPLDPTVTSTSQSRPPYSYRSPAPDQPRQKQHATEIHKLQPGLPGELTPIVRVINASKNLTLADFRRLVPKARNLEGWNYAEIDIIKVIPSRHLHDLSQKSEYLLIFSDSISALAFTKQVKMMHSLAKEYTSRSTSSKLSTPPNYMVDNMNVSEVIAAFAVAAPDQPFALAVLRWPLARLIQSNVMHGGFEVLCKRPERKPFELRLTLEGRQISYNAMRSMFSQSGNARGMSWSGDQSSALAMMEWRTSTPYLDEWQHSNVRSTEKSPSAVYNSRRPVYVVGFDTEDSAQSFLHYWHMRPLGSSTATMDPEALKDEPPIVNLEMLW